MSFSKLIAAIFFTLVSPNADPDLSETASRGTRKKKCPSCGIALQNHDFGEQGPTCEGPPIEPTKTPTHSSSSSSSKRSPATILKRNSATALESSPDANGVDFKREQLRQLKIEQREMTIEIMNFEEKKLQEEIERRMAEIERLRASRKAQTSSQATLPSLFEQPPHHPRDFPSHATNAAMLGSLTNKDSLLLPPDNVSSLLGNISSLIDNQQRVSPQYQGIPFQQQNQGILFQQQQQQQPSSTSSRLGNIPAAVPVDHRSSGVDQTELFLRPTRANHITRGKALRVVDFVSRIRPSEDEKVLSCDNNCKLTLTLQDTKPKLSAVTVEQFNIANLRIFYELLFSGKLSTLRAIQEYLSYAIKVLELATKYTWESVLLYDDEFRILQHTYGFSWSTDHSHLHEVVLMPRWAVRLPHFKQGYPSSPPYNIPETGNKGLPPNAVSHLPSGAEICRLFNSRKGCQRSPCKFSHVCNRRVGSQACGKAHPGFSHSSGAETPRQ